MLSTIISYIMCSLILMALTIGLIRYLCVDLIKMIFIAVILIFFPITIPFMGRDALSTGGAFILILYVAYIVNTIKNREIIIEKYDYLIYLLIFFGALSNKIAFDQGYITGEDIGPVIRQYLSFVTSLLFFLVVKNAIMHLNDKDGSALTSITEKMLSLILILTALHVVISVINKYIPLSIEIVKIFYNSESHVFEPEGQDRLTGFVFSYEYYGEMLAALCPLVIYKLVTTRKLSWFLCLVIFTCGVLLSVTRSGILLFALGLSVSIFYHYKRQVRNAILLSVALFGTVMVFVSVYPQICSDLIDRFTLAEDAYSSGGNLFDTINRGNLPDIWDDVITHLTLSGHSMLRVDYHNLFLTTLHQMGVMGALLFFIALLYPSILLLKSIVVNNRSRKALRFSCLLFIALFLINETKVEFTRADSYSQICWGLFALCYLVTKHSSMQQDCQV